MTTTRQQRRLETDELNWIFRRFVCWVERRAKSHFWVDGILKAGPDERQNILQFLLRWKRSDARESKKRQTKLKPSAQTGRQSYNKNRMKKRRATKSREWVRASTNEAYAHTNGRNAFTVVPEINEHSHRNLFRAIFYRKLCDTVFINIVGRQ